MPSARRLPQRQVRNLHLRILISVRGPAHNEQLCAVTRRTRIRAERHLSRAGFALFPGRLRRQGGFLTPLRVHMCPLPVVAVAQLER